MWFEELEIALIHRALNTERNLLARLYGVDKDGKKISGYVEGDTFFKEDTSWQKQIDAIFAAEEKLIKMEEAWKREMAIRRNMIEG